MDANDVRLGNNPVAILRPSIAHIDDGWLVQGLPFILQGADFAPNQTVGLYLDAANGQLIGTASVNSNGSFQSQFTMPYNASAGNHTLVAIEGTGANAKEAKLAVFVDYALQ